MSPVEPAVPPGEGELLLAVVREMVVERHSADAAAAATLDSGFDRELGLDSLALAELLSRVEGVFGVSLPVGTLGVIETPRDLLQAIRGASRTGVLHLRHGRYALPSPAERIPDTVATVTGALAWHVGVHPDRQHVRIVHEEADEVLSYRDLQRSAARVAAGLQSRELRLGDAVALMLPTGRDYFASFAGVLLAGGVPVPIYPPMRRSQLADHLRRQVAILDNARATLLVTDPGAARLGRLVRGHVASLRHVVTPVELAEDGAANEVGRDAADVALLQYTSGSTGNPKGVVLTHANLLSNIRAMAQAA